MHPRVRFRSLAGTVGYRYPVNFDGSPAGPDVARVSPGDVHRCEDVVGNQPNANPLIIEHFERRPGTITGVATVFPVFGLRDYPYDGQPTWDMAPIDTGDMLSDADYLAKLAADTNPTKASVSIPNLIWESIPSAVRSVGNRIVESDSPWRNRPQYRPEKIRERGLDTNNSVAAHNFGWGQLYRDVSSLFNFADQVNRKVNEINRIFDKGGTTRRRVVWSGKGSVDIDRLVQADVVGVTVRERTTTLTRKWVSLRWKPYDPLYLSNPKDRLQEARRLVHGWSNAPARVWEALPWSWLIDYFGNIGNVINSSANDIRVTASNCCVMTMTHSVVEHEVLTVNPPGNQFTVRPGKSEYTLKQRTLGSIGLSAHLPVISAGQLTTLLGISANYIPPVGTV